MDISIVYKSVYEKQAFAAAYSLISAIVSLRSRGNKPEDITEDVLVKDLLKDVEKWSNAILATEGSL